jgi:hypothetical protein
MKVTVMSMWLNEEFMAPFFLKHYWWADEIFIILDTATCDRTESILRQYERVRLGSFSFQDGFDSSLRAAEFNRQSQLCNADWLIVVDADELVFPASYADPRDQLLGEKADVVFARMWQIFRAEGEAPLIPEIPPLLQRRHGDPNRNRGKNALYNKPCIFRPGRGIELSAGQHYFRAPVGTTVSRRQFYGSHWAFSDLDLAIHRQIVNGKERLSQAEIDHGLSKHWLTASEASIRQTTRLMEHSPLLLQPRWLMIVTEWLNRLMIIVLTGETSWRVSVSSHWYNGSQPDLFDVWADRRLYAGQALKALKKLIPT